jgi:hypothetical protein
LCKSMSAKSAEEMQKSSISLPSCFRRARFLFHFSVLPTLP